MADKTETPKKVVVESQEPVESSKCFVGSSRIRSQVLMEEYLFSGMAA